MPELPEVETVVRDLQPLLVGRRISSVQVGKQKLRRAWSKEWNGQLVGRRVAEVRRRGKWILVCLDDGRVLVFHLGMTGQLYVVPAKAPGQTHTHVVLSLDRGGQELRFRDIRRFGSATLYPAPEAVEQDFAAAGLGPEPFGLDPEYLRGKLKGTKRSLKAVLLDQSVVAGVGNIYADEVLWTARLFPTLKGHRVTRAQSVKLRDAIEAVLEKAIQARGSTIRDYVGGSGLRGGYQEEFAVYGRTGEPCRACGTPIERMRLAGRSTHYCPRCQRK